MRSMTNYCVTTPNYSKEWKTQKISAWFHRGLIFLERIPFLSSQLSIDAGRPQDTLMVKWVSLMAHYGGEVFPTV